MAGFDNVGYSMISVFQSMTLSNWSFSMYRTMDFLSPVVVIYWLAMIIFGAYFVVSSRCCGQSVPAFQRESHWQCSSSSSRWPSPVCCPTRCRQASRLAWLCTTLPAAARFNMLPVIIPAEHAECAAAAFKCLLQLNLFLAVLKTKFAKAQSLLHEKRRHRRALKGQQGRSKRNVLMKAAGWAKG
jgi:hypothetical protein